MGTSTCAGVVPFAAPNIWSGDYFSFDPKHSDHLPPEGLSTLLVWNEWKGTLDDGTYVEDFPDEMDPRTFNGWTLDPDEIKVIDSLYFEVIRHEDGRVVYFINESQYSSGGGLVVTFTADDPATLRAFLNDLDLEGEIHAPYAAQQTL